MSGPSTMLGVRAVVLAGVLVVGVAVPVSVSVPASPAAAQAACDNEVNPQTCEAGAGRPGRTVDLTAEVGPRVSGGEKECLSGNPGGPVSTEQTHSEERPDEDE